MKVPEEDSEDLNARVTYDPFADRLIVRYESGRSLRFVDVEDGIWASFDAEGHAVEVLAEAATMGRPRKWRQQLRDLAGPGIVGKLDELDAEGIGTTNAVVVATHEVEELRRNWAGILACNSAGKKVAEHWREFLTVEQATPSVTSRLRAGAVKWRAELAELLQSGIDSLIIRPVQPTFIVSRGPSDSSVGGGIPSQQFKFRIDGLLATAASISHQGSGRVQGRRITLTLERTSKSDASTDIAAVIVGSDDEAIAGPVLFKVDPDTPSFLEAGFDIAEDVAIAVADAAKSGRDFEASGLTLELSTGGFSG